MKKIYFAVLLGLAHFFISAQTEFITTWKTDNPGSSGDNQITIPTFDGETYNYSIDWGDGSSDSGITADITHTYSSPGTYTVSITGAFPRIDFEPSQDSQKILSIDQWGSIQWTSMEGAFDGCTKMNINATDIPDLSGVTSLKEMFIACFALTGNASMDNWDVSTITDMSGMFSSAIVFNQDLNNWNVSKVSSMHQMFASAFNFNGNISSWDVGSVTILSQMFQSATAFNQDISNWDVSNVQFMTRTFSSATSFDQDIGNWNVSSVTSMNALFLEAESFNSDIGSWDVSNVQDMGLMFESAVLFNQDLSGWNVSNATSMTGMFQKADSFNQDISSWDVSGVLSMSGMFASNPSFNQDLGSWDVSSILSMTFMFSGSALSTENYDSTLEGWSSLPSLRNNVTFDGGNSQYCQAGQARQKLIDNYGWRITDGGRLAICSEDNDNDGVLDFRDSCLDTKPGVAVNPNGCEAIAVDAIIVIVNSTACPDSGNGSIELATHLIGFQYNLTLNGPNTDQQFYDVDINPSYLINDLSPGDYTLIVAIPGILYEQQYGLRITELSQVTGKREFIDRTNRAASYTVSGSVEYEVEVNGIAQYYVFNSTDTQQIIIENLKEQNEVLIKGSNDCQGYIADSFAISKQLILYPILTEGEVFIEGPFAALSYKLFDIYGKLVKSKDVTTNLESSIKLDALPSGLYLLQINNNGITKTHKIIKR